MTLGETLDLYVKKNYYEIYLKKTQTFGGWEVMQEVLPKQAPDAAETNGKKEDVEKRVTGRKKKAEGAQRCGEGGADSVHSCRTASQRRLHAR